MLGLICAAGAGRAGYVGLCAVRRGREFGRSTDVGVGEGAEAEDEWRGWVKMSFCWRCDLLGPGDDGIGS